jgi:hypothetical protein
MTEMNDAERAESLTEHLLHAIDEWQRRHRCLVLGDISCVGDRLKHLDEAWEADAQAAAKRR